MHARSALFDVYGDLLAQRDNRSSVAGLVRLLEPTGIAAPAVRTAISRMVSQGWLEPVTVSGARGYAATNQAIGRLDAARERIYRRATRAWDKSWQLVFVSTPIDRSARARVQRELSFLGYAEMADLVWISPFVRRELEAALDRAGARATTAVARDFSPPGAPAAAWDLERLATAYSQWHASAEAEIDRHLAGHDDADEAAFAARFHLVHEWRKFLFEDPGLPDELLPPDWPGRTAASFFTEAADRLQPGADRFVATLSEHWAGRCPVGGRLGRQTDGMTADPVLVDVADGVATITLNRPDAMNSLDIATKVALRDAVHAVAEDDAARCVVLTGTGRAFCVGQDLKEHISILQSGSSDQLFSTVEEHYNPIVSALATMEKPVIAAVNGVAAGAGASLALACDLRILADTAGFNFAFAGVALSCDTGSSWTLPRLVGREKALELLYLPSTVDAEESRRIGLASRVVPADELATAAEELAGRLASGPTVAYASIRASVAFSAEHSFTDSLAFEGQMMTRTGATHDHSAAVESFVAKQKPVFEGR